MVKPMDLKSQIAEESRIDCIDLSMAWMATAGDVSVAVDDRDLNHFALNPSCNVTWRYADHG